MSINKVIITGAASGIGSATAISLLESETPVELWLISRNLQAIREIKELHNKNNSTIHISQVDVRDKEQVQNWANEVKKVWSDCQVLINNAGLALGAANFIDSEVEDWDIMIDTNVKGLLYVTHAILPLIKISENTKHIINIGSTAGKMVYENGHVYCATKYAVDALSQGLRIDLLPYGVKVTSVNPGMVSTNFSLTRYKGNAEIADRVYDGFEVLQPQDIAQVIHFVMSLPPHVNINDVTLTCTQQANSVYKYKK